jgi:hypothetical protein
VNYAEHENEYNEEEQQVGLIYEGISRLFQWGNSGPTGPQNWQKKPRNTASKAAWVIVRNRTVHALQDIIQLFVPHHQGSRAMREGIVDVLMPQSVRQKQEESEKQVYKTLETVSNVIVNAPRGSVQKRTATAILCEATQAGDTVRNFWNAIQKGSRDSNCTHLLYPRQLMTTVHW